MLTLSVCVVVYVPFDVMALCRFIAITDWFDCSVIIHVNVGPGSIWNQ